MANSKKINNLPVLSGDVTLSNYLNEIKKFPMLSAEEEYTLATRLRIHGDTDAAHQLVTSHLRLVAKLAMGYKVMAYQLQILCLKEMLGLCKQSRSLILKKVLD